MKMQINFLQNEFPVLLNQLKDETKPIWGIMSAQQMVEHLGRSFLIANGTVKFDVLMVDDETSKKKLDWILTNAPVEQNMKSPFVPKTPEPLKYPNLDTAKSKMLEQLNKVFLFYNNFPNETLIHPMFGPLDFDHQIAFLYKHIQHHCKQFGLR
jgi:hydroxymethylglutaryl-CoA reductase